MKLSLEVIQDRASYWAERVRLAEDAIVRMAKAEAREPSILGGATQRASAFRDLLVPTAKWYAEKAAA